MPVSRSNRPQSHWPEPPALAGRARPQTSRRRSSRLGRGAARPRNQCNHRNTGRRWSAWFQSSGARIRGRSVSISAPSSASQGPHRRTLYKPPAGRECHEEGSDGRYDGRSASGCVAAHPEIPGAGASLAPIVGGRDGRRLHSCRGQRSFRAPSVAAAPRVRTRTCAPDAAEPASAPASAAATPASASTPPASGTGSLPRRT